MSQKGEAKTTECIAVRFSQVDATRLRWAFAILIPAVYLPAVRRYLKYYSTHMEASLRVSFMIC
jgi:hypothetical protein